MTSIARMAVLDLRTVWPYRFYCLAVFALGVLVFANKPIWFVPGLVLLFTSQIAAYPFNVSDKAGLETLYAVLPLSRRWVIYGHYAWATACFLATATVGTTLALLLAGAQSMPFGGRTLVTMLTLSWALFAVNVAIQFPLLIRFGYTRVSVLGTTLPLAAVVGTVYRLHLNMESIQSWLPFLCAAGVAAIMTSAAVAIAADRLRVRHSSEGSLHSRQ
jgi:ABC-2 family transporter protein